MVVEETRELVLLDVALQRHAQHLRAYAATQPPLRARQFKYEVDVSDGMRLRLYREHFPKDKDEIAQLMVRSREAD